VASLVSAARTPLRVLMWRLPKGKASFFLVKNEVVKSQLHG
jgi:hypothetical protein